MKPRLARLLGAELEVRHRSVVTAHSLGGAAASRAELLKEVWQYQQGVLSRTIDIHIAELRRKLEKNPAQPRHIRTVWKVGYRLER